MATITTSKEQQKMNVYPLLFEPNLHELVWGGNRLEALKGLRPDGLAIGESWEISNIPGNESVIANGEYAGLTLGELIQKAGAELVGKTVFRRHGNEFPLLVKFIDAAHDLSIQVHPNDTLAQARHGKLGKTEMWYVMHAEPGASLLAGFSQEITKEEYERRVADGSIVDVLARHPVKAGDVFFIPAGRVHAICGGILLCEIQQSSDVTYRLFDYNRMGLDGKPRELHTQLAKDAIDFHVYPQYRTPYEAVSEGWVRIVDCPYFAVNVLATSSNLTRNLRSEGSFVTLSSLQGNAIVTGSHGNQISLPMGMSCLIPASVADYTIASADGFPVRLLEAWAR